MYAVFRSGGKQYRASQGERLRVEKLEAAEGANVSFDQVLLVGEGAEVQVGRPLLDGTAVTAKVLRQGKSRKVPVVKFRRRQNYLRQGSHRQFFTEVEILAIGAAADAPKAEAAADKPAAKKAATKKAATKKAAAKKSTAKKASKKTASE
ncbi:MAG: 50S ribosomal protein L21 [Gammaproteobacteria bacterium]|nr:50S ribosomal protein L21 [Gammaproteobacteria bacterium]MDH4253380.1 50S ribosomal protein L21 [Gammaproteobacteria bacterium]MDH5310309.1 50S ribosomal protein L21 [Gammaproteobacteria bacterium]